MTHVATHFEHGVRCRDLLPGDILVGTDGLTLIISTGTPVWIWCDTYEDEGSELTFDIDGEHFQTMPEDSFSGRDLTRMRVG